MKCTKLEVTSVWICTDNLILHKFDSVYNDLFLKH